MPVSTESFPDNVPLAQAKSDRVKFTFESAAGTGSASGNALLSQDKATQELLEKWYEVV